MVTLPAEFVAIKYPGYFYNTQDKTLYSVKVTGMLKPLRHGPIVQRSPSGQLVYTGAYGYRISVAGKKKYVTDDYLSKLNNQVSQVFPVFKKSVDITNSSV